MVAARPKGGTAKRGRDGASDERAIAWMRVQDIEPVTRWTSPRSSPRASRDETVSIDFHATTASTQLPHREGGTHRRGPDNDADWD